MPWKEVYHQTNAMLFIVDYLSGGHQERPVATIAGLSRPIRTTSGTHRVPAQEDSMISPEDHGSIPTHGTIVENPIAGAAELMDPVMRSTSALAGRGLAGVAGHDPQATNHFKVQGKNQRRRVPPAAWSSATLGTVLGARTSRAYPLAGATR